MPYGLNGLLAGAASCFFAYIGFDGLATAGEEASDPSRAIPVATFISMSIVTAAYILMSAALTLMVPFRQVNPTAAFSDAFASRGAEWAKYIVSIGAMSGMTTSLVGSMFALPRCVYAMAEDGLLYSTFSQISDKTQVGGRIRKWVPFQSWLTIPQPGILVTWSVFMMIIGDVGMSIIFASGSLRYSYGIVCAVLFGLIAGLAFILICLHHQNNAQIDFKVPLVPLVPSVSILVNVLLMMHLAPVTWLRLIIWLLIGFAIYGTYGIKHSREELSMTSEDLPKSRTYESVISDSTQ
ncbi:unnamed protein product [Anisakis simplex]|uniref:Cationic amino acid transporter 4 (inferred by orthology to a human protein) n=1 Tax=Anisakis simplex TaxID=6269 RepID=A0A0M3IZJ2_ANISI|nr:unnamed protein product [Anisakis simplex]